MASGKYKKWQKAIDSKLLPAQSGQEAMNRTTQFDICLD